MHPIPDDMELTTIQVSKGTRELLRKSGTKGETYNEIIRRLLKEHDEESNEP